MEIERDDINYNPPRSSNYEVILSEVASSIGSDILSFDSNGFDFISNSIIPPIQTDISVLVVSMDMSDC